MISRVRRIPRGDAGILRTVKEMRRLVQGSLTSPLTVESAAAIVSPWETSCQRAQGVRDYLAEYVRFVPDPLGFELLRAPDFMLNQIGTQGYAAGDCDDIAILGAALGKAVGMPARFVLIGFSPDRPWEHVFTELATERGWAELDTSAPAQFPPNLVVHRTRILEV